jgi:NAD(P)-dependent dehydrogenase (short-subunit alcohol dehydrogenase family)
VAQLFKEKIPMLQPSDMTGKAALVTGAAAGLGKATALRLARAGCDISLVDINEQALAAVAEAVRALGVSAVVQALDLADAANCRLAVSATVSAFDRLDALCNVAGVFIPSHAQDMSTVDWDKTLAVNLSAPFHLIQAALPNLLESHGAIVNVTSCAAHIGQAYTAAYCASKAGLTHLTKALAMEFMQQPIRINAVAPGGMMTTLAMGITKLQDPDPSLLKRYHPLRGVVEIDDAAEMVAFLASDAARGYHGAVINIDKGVTAG